MYETPDGWDSDREEADYLQARLEELGRAAERGRRRMLALRTTDPAAAARACRHGAGYPLASPAAYTAHDPRAGQPGVRCTGCGSVLSGFPWDGPAAILIPCEEPPAE
jgi:hypothetical protein